MSNTSGLLCRVRAGGDSDEDRRRAAGISIQDRLKDAGLDCESEHDEDDDDDLDDEDLDGPLPGFKTVFLSAWLLAEHEGVILAT